MILNYKTYYKNIQYTHYKRKIYFNDNTFQQEHISIHFIHHYLMPWLNISDRI